VQPWTTARHTSHLISSYKLANWESVRVHNKPVTNSGRVVRDSTEKISVSERVGKYCAKVKVSSIKNRTTVLTEYQQSQS